MYVTKKADIWISEKRSKKHKNMCVHSCLCFSANISNSACTSKREKNEFIFTNERAKTTINTGRPLKTFLFIISCVTGL